MIENSTIEHWLKNLIEQHEIEIYDINVVDLEEIRSGIYEYEAEIDFEFPVEIRLYDENHNKLDYPVRVMSSCFSNVKGLINANNNSIDFSTLSGGLKILTFYVRNRLDFSEKDLKTIERFEESDDVSEIKEQILENLPRFKAGYFENL